MNDMPVQYQKRPEANDFRDAYEAEPQRSPKARNVKKPLGKSLLLLLAIPLLCLSFFLGRMFREENTFFLEERTVDGYLSPQDYILVDEDTGEPGQKLRSLHLEHMSSSDYMATNRGIRRGSSWQEVVDAYGDDHAVYISYTPDCLGADSIDHEKDVDVEGPVTVSEFNESYVKTGKCNPDTDRIYIEFELCHDGYHLYYTEEELQKAIDAYYDMPSFMHFKYPYPGWNNFELSISLYPGEGVTYISTYYL